MSAAPFEHSKRAHVARSRSVRFVNGYAGDPRQAAVGRFSARRLRLGKASRYVSGECIVRAGVLLGAASVTLQALTVGNNAVAGAAACVVNDAAPGEDGEGGTRAMTSAPVRQSRRDSTPRSAGRAGLHRAGSGVLG